MAVFSSIITPEEFNAYLDEKVKPGDDPFLDFKQNLILACVAAIEKYTTLDMASAARSQTFDGDAQRGFWLTYRPVNSITSVTLSGSVIAATEYSLRAGIGYIKFRDYTTTGWQNYVIAYNAGYGLANVPLPIKQACKIWTAYHYKKAMDRRHGVSAISAADQSVTYFEKGMPEDVAELLNPYRLILARTS